MYLENYGTLSGYLAHDCEIRMKNDKSKEFVVFTICYNSTYKDNDKANYFDVVYFNSDYSAFCPYLKKGSLVRVYYALKDDKWTDENNRTRRNISIVADKVEILQSIRRREEEKEGQM